MKNHAILAIQVLIICLLIGAIPARSQGNLVLNGSFEDGSGSLNNWIVAQFGPNPSPGVELGGAAIDGNYCALFTRDGGSISQTLSTTAGVFYDLNFWALQYDGTNRSSVSVNGSLLSAINFSRYVFISPLGQNNPFYQINTNWENFNFVFQATSANTSLLFSETPFTYVDSDHTFYDSHGGLDAISVTVVPEPSAVALLGVGLAGWLARRRLS